MDGITLRVPAKINTFLAATGRLANGYHTVLSHMARVALFDTIQLKPKKSTAGIVLTCCSGEESVPMDVSNLAYRAAAAFFHALRMRGGVSIALEKHIPSGAGLGGGSSDAASVLLGLNRLYGNPFTEDGLREIALPLGADVPFFLWADTHPAATARGIGEVLQETVSLPAEVSFLIAKPIQSVATPLAYRRLDELGLVGNAGDEKAYTAFETALASGRLTEIAASSRNDFEKAVVPDCSEVERLLHLLPENGAAFARMSGSGSAVVGWFDDAEKAEVCLAQLKKESWLSFAEIVKSY